MFVLSGSQFCVFVLAVCGHVDVLVQAAGRHVHVFVQAAGGKVYVGVGRSPLLLQYI